MVTKATQDGLVRSLNDYNSADSANWQLRLYASAHTPAVTDTSATYTAIEAAGAWYTPLACPIPAGAIWDGVSKALANAVTTVTWTSDGTGSGTIFGWFLWNNALGLVQGAGEFVAPLDMSIAGQTIVLGFSDFMGAA